MTLCQFLRKFTIGDTYSVGKAGLNMVVRKYGAALKALGSPIILINVYPGSFILLFCYTIPDVSAALTLKKRLDSIHRIGSRA